MRATLSSWGNSAGIRIPKAILKEIGASIGDVFDLSTGEDGCLYLTPVMSQAVEHRQVAPANVSFNQLFAGYEYCQIDTAWADDGMKGAEWEAWS